MKKLTEGSAINKQSVLNPRAYTFDGALWVPSEHFKSFAPDFLKRSRRFLSYGNRTVLRGTRYTISSNPTFEVRQKLDNLVEDFEEGLIALSDVSNPVYAAAIADYIKNATITLLNSFLMAEKIGKFGFSNPTYQALRKDGQALCEAACDLFYGLIFARPASYNRAYSELVETGTEVLKRIENRILHEYREGTFSSRHLTRPEAAHPLVIGGFAIRIGLDRRQNPDIIVGMPAGATELAMATKASLKLLKNKNVPVMLFPASLHSIKHDFDNVVGNPKDMEALVNHHRAKFRGKSVLVVDDNSSTGRTLDIVTSKIADAKPKSMKAFVAEADIIRTQLRMADGDVESVAAPIIYSMSLNVLPVSRKISPKQDLKQLNEKRRMIACVRQRYLSPEANPVNQIIGEIYVDLIKRPNMKTGEPNQISHFRKTFLSNFTEASVLLDRVKYGSVEHAYQRAKFTQGSLEALTDDHVRIINKTLAPRNEAIEKHGIQNFFANPLLTAGTSKVVGSQLRILGYVREDWDHVKLPIMVSLLLQKFTNGSLYGQLQATGDRELVEGNDWGDTYWGVCDDRGRNVLGRVLMLLRRYEKRELFKLTKLVEKMGIPNYSVDDQFESKIDQLVS